MALEESLRKAEKIVEPYRPKLGSEGYVIEAMTARQEIKNNVVIDGEAYHAYAVDVLTAYCRVTVVGYKSTYLKLKLQLPIRTVAVV